MSKQKYDAVMMDIRETLARDIFVRAAAISGGNPDDEWPHGMTKSESLADWAFKYADCFLETAYQERVKNG